VVLKGIPRKWGNVCPCMESAFGTGFLAVGARRRTRHSAGQGDQCIPFGAIGMRARSGHREPPIPA
jgi:hypothetical protein